MENPPITERLAIRYQDLDPYGHVNNAVHLALCESVRVAYMRGLARGMGLGDLEAGDIPGVRYLVAEASLRYKAPIFLDDTVHGAARITYVSNRSCGMEYELRVGESYETGRVAAQASTALVFYDPDEEEIRPRPDWFLSAVADFEGRSEEDFNRKG
ncbi:acyl-CoA thioesterase [Rubrobacter aplysinae]|uniref:acyl-CoA thioesterase n=1 Tax=Rubrobacter aplysinae TaxID=909625 RepID=UPI00064C0B7B|nr:acyl-CoA thioesterase [Rubrobacter aplysinae]